MYQVSMVPGNKLHEVEDEVFAWLQPAIEYTAGRFSRESFAEDIRAGRCQLWIAFDDETLNIVGAIVTKIEVYPHKTMLCYALCGGDDFANWHNSIYDLIFRFAMDQGCDGLEGVGRKGWNRFLTNNYGWEECFTYMQYFPEKEDVQDVA